MSDGGHELLREVTRELLRELLPELLHDDAGGGRANGSARNRSAPGLAAGAPAPVPLVPAPPVAAVLRPSTWSAPPAPGEVIGEGVDAPAPPGAPAPSDPSAPAPAREPSATRSPSPARDHSSAKRSSPAAPGPSRPRRPGRVETVRVADQRDLDSFVAMLALRLESPQERRALRTGELRFVLSDTAAAGRAHGAPAEAPVLASAHRIDRGAVTERLVREAAAGGMRLVLGPGAVLTPLARDRARAMGVQIEREG